jgi:hypothetical protein
MSSPYLDESSVEDLARMVVALLSEVWIMRDRMAVMEKLLEDGQSVTSRALDDYVPDAAFSESLEQLRDRLVGNVIGAPVSGRDRTVDSILKRAKLERE